MQISELIIDIGRPIAYYPSFAKIFGVKETVFLCQLLFWTGKQADPDGWIYKSADELYEELGMTYKVQKVVREHLREFGVLEEMEKRIDHKIFFRVNRERLDEHWESVNPARSTVGCPNDQREVPEMPKGTFGEVPTGIPTNNKGNTTKTTGFVGNLFTISSDSLPPPLNTPAMQDAWDLWQEHRRQIKHPLTQLAANQQIQELKKWGPERAVAAIKYSIKKQWRDIWEEKDRDRNGSAPAKGRGQFKEDFSHLKAIRPPEDL